MQHSSPGLVTLALRQVWRATRGMTLGVRIVATRADGRICLVRHTYMPGLHLPGGGVERDETIFDAASKELRQETGVSASPNEFRLFGVYLNRPFRGDHVALVSIASVVATGSPDPREIAEVVWADPAFPPADATAATTTRIAEVRGGLAPAPYWT